MQHSKNRKTNSINGSPIKKIYALLKISNPNLLYEAYLNEDQKNITSKTIDYFDPKLIINKIKNILESIDPEKLSKQEKLERKLILWLWYHHAISYAIWGYKDKKMAMKYTSVALKYQPRNHPNKITRLLYLLVRDRLSEAKKWTQTIGKEEKETAINLVNFYKEGGFFK